MNYKHILLSQNQKYFEINGQKLWNKTFINAMKFHEPGLAPVQDENGWFHIDTWGNELYNKRYTRAFGFYCNRAAVVENNNCLHINEKGLRIYSENFLWCGNFQEDICTVRNAENKYFHIDLNGHKIYHELYLYAGDFKDGYACVQLQNGLFKHIDKFGNYIYENEFVDLNIFHKGYATAKDRNGWFHIDKNGTEIYTNRYLLAEPFYNGSALMTDFDDKKLLIDEQGKIILKF